MILSPNLDNFRVEFDGNLFPVHLTEKYDRFLHQMNSPIKSIHELVHETIIAIDTPSITIPEISVDGLNNKGNNMPNSGGNKGQNTTNLDYISNAPFISALSSNSVTITMHNNLWNYVYINELMRLMFTPKNGLNEFSTYCYMNTDGDIPIMRFSFRNCIVKSIPQITFTHADTLTANPTFDVVVRFNNFDFDFMLPEFKQTIKML